MNHESPVSDRDAAEAKAASPVALTGDYSTDVAALLELLRDSTESLVVSCQLLESSESVVDRHHAKQNLERWKPIWRELDRNRGRIVQPAGVPVACVDPADLEQLKASASVDVRLYRSGATLTPLFLAPPGASPAVETGRAMVLPERIDRKQYLGTKGDAVAKGWNDCLDWIDKANA